MGPCRGSESILIYDSRILLGSVAVTSEGKVNLGPKDASLFSRFSPSLRRLKSLCSIPAHLRETRGTADSLRAAHEDETTACPAESARRSQLWTEGYRCVAEEETTESLIPQTPVGVVGMTFGALQFL